MKIYNLARGVFSGMWMTLSRHIWRKRQVMEEWAEGVNREHDLIKELRDCTDPVRKAAIVEELELTACNPGRCTLERRRRGLFISNIRAEPLQWP